MRSLISIAAILVVTLLSVDAYPAHISKTQDAICQNGGNAACWSYCKVSGHGGGHCEGVNPNVNCVCDHLLNKTKDAPCEDGGNAGCLAYCAIEGYNCGYCSGVHPNTQCICEHCPAGAVTCQSRSCGTDICIDGFCYGDPSFACACDSSQDKTNNCTNENCLVSCLEKGCKSGICSGNPNDPCECADCSAEVEAPPPSCNQTACANSCKQVGKNCSSGCWGAACHCHCGNDTEVGEPDCPSSECVSTCKSHGCQGAKCIHGGPDQCLCYGCKDLAGCDPLGCMSKCQAEGYKQGMCGPTGDCQCAFPNASVLAIDAGVPCMLGGDSFCQNICAKANCSKGHCGLSGHKEYCVCQDCNEEIDQTPSTEVAFPHSGCDWGQCKSYCEARGMNGCCSAGSPSGCVCCSSPVACQQQCNVDTSVVSDSTTLVIVGKPHMSCEVGGRAACIASCKVQGCETGYCEGPADNATCVCSRCSMNSTSTALAIVDRSRASCQIGGDGACELSCQLHNCNDGHCTPDGTCVCSGCVVEPEKTTGVVLVGNPRMSCEVGGRAACIASCKVQGCETGYCEGPADNATCVCSRCSLNKKPALALHVINKPTATCTTGGQFLCSAICALVRCDYGNCTSTGGSDDCVCGGCNGLPHIKQA